MGGKWNSAGCVLIGLSRWGGKSQCGSLKSWVQGLAGVFPTLCPRTAQKLLGCPSGELDTLLTHANASLSGWGQMIFAIVSPFVKSGPLYIILPLAVFLDSFPVQHTCPGYESQGDTHEDRGHESSFTTVPPAPTTVVVNK